MTSPTAGHGPTAEGLARERTRLARARTALGAATLAGAILHAAVTTHDPVHAMAALTWSCFAIIFLVPTARWTHDSCRQHLVMCSSSAAATIACALTFAATI